MMIAPTTMKPTTNAPAVVAITKEPNEAHLSDTLSTSLCRQLIVLGIHPSKE